VDFYESLECILQIFDTYDFGSSLIPPTESYKLLLEFLNKNFEELPIKTDSYFSKKKLIKDAIEIVLESGLGINDKSNSLTESGYIVFKKDEKNAVIVQISLRKIFILNNKENISILKF